MILTDYYKFVHLPDSKSKTRIDCVCCTKSYNDFECLRNRQGKLFVYYGDVPDNFKASVKRKADKAITKAKNISSVFHPDLELNTFAYGDVKGTEDAILVIHDKDDTEFDIFVARGKKGYCLNLWQELSGGELDNEISMLREKAVIELITDKSNEKLPI
jgi:hypothetical protein